MKIRRIRSLMLSIIALALVGFAQCTCPVAIDDEATTYLGFPITVYVLFNDVDADGDLLWLYSFTQPENGVVTMGNWTDNRLTYIPDAEFCGEDSFNYIATDGDCESNEATVLITVECACTATAPEVCVCEGTTADEVMSIIEDCADCGGCGETPVIEFAFTKEPPEVGEYSYEVICYGDRPDYAEGTVSVRPLECEFSDFYIQGDLYIGKKLTDGIVTVTIVDDELEVTFDLAGTDYYLDETQVWVGKTPPPCNPGKTKGYVIEGNLGGEQTRTTNVPMPEDLVCGDNLYIGAHLETTDGETGWAGDLNPNCKNWAHYMTVENVECDCTCDCDPEGCQI